MPTNPARTEHTSAHELQLEVEKGNTTDHHNLHQIDNQADTQTEQMPQEKQPQDSELVEEHAGTSWNLNEYLLSRDRYIRVIKPPNRFTGSNMVAYALNTAENCQNMSQ